MSRSASSWFCIALILAMLSAIGGCSRNVPGGAQFTAAGDSHERMLAVLRQVQERTADENKFLGDAMARRLRKELAALPADALAVDRLRLNWSLASEELRLGDTDEAIDLMTAAYPLLPEAASA